MTTNVPQDVIDDFKEAGFPIHLMFDWENRLSKFLQLRAQRQQGAEPVAWMHHFNYEDGEHEEVLSHSKEIPAIMGAEYAGKSIPLYTTPPQANALVSDDLLKFKLDLLQVASCTCGTKTPEAKYHTDSCRYRLICEIQNDVDALRTQLADATRKLEEARKDAERWAEFMRNTKFSIWYWCGSGKSPNKPISNAEAIALIDQAIEQGKGGDE
jgi:hypothetical protein